jgi:tetratricopeptide (TPR) repeat protein
VYDFFGNRFEECCDEARQVLENRPDDLVALVSLGWARLEIQWHRYGPHWEEERRDLLEFARDSHKLYPNHPHIRCILAFALHINGLCEDAVETAERAILIQLRRRERPIVGPRILGTILRMQGELARAREVFAKYFGARPGDGRLRFRPGQMLEAEKNYRAALEEYRARVDRGPKSARPYSLLARSLNRDERYEEAVENATAAIERLPRNSGGYEQLAYALWKLGRSAEAFDVVAEGLEKLPGRIRLLLVRGWILEGLGEVEHAAKAYGEVLSLHPGYPEAQEALRELLRRNEKLVLLPEIIELSDVIERHIEGGRGEELLLDILSLIKELSRREDGTDAANR